MVCCVLCMCAKAKNANNTRFYMHSGNVELMVTKLPENGWRRRTLYNSGGNSINVFVFVAMVFIVHTQAESFVCIRYLGCHLSRAHTNHVIFYRKASVQTMRLLAPTGMYTHLLNGVCVCIFSFDFLPSVFILIKYFLPNISCSVWQSKELFSK